eukprot:gene15508-biopygen17040
MRARELCAWSIRIGTLQRRL